MRDHGSLRTNATAVSCPALEHGGMLVLLLSLAVAADSMGLFSLPLERTTLNPRRLKVLSQVLNGPARNSFLIIYLDATLSPWDRQAVLGLKAMQHAPRLTLTLGAAHRWSPRLQTFDASTLHLVLFFNLHPLLLHHLWQLFKPRNLLFFSLQSTGGADFISDDSLGGVERLALIANLKQREATESEALGVYTVFPLCSSKPRLLGQWQPHIFYDWKALFPDRFPTLHGHKLMVEGWPHDWPFLHDHDPRQMSGISLKMVQHLSHKLNFTFRLTWDTDSYKVDFLKTNGSWASALGKVYNRQVNFSCIPMTPDEDIYADFDTTKSFWSDGYSAFLARPIPTFGWSALILPFSVEVWVAVVIVAAAAVGLVTLQVSHSSRDGTLKLRNTLFCAIALLNEERITAKLQSNPITTKINSLCFKRLPASRALT